MQYSRTVSITASRTDQPPLAVPAAPALRDIQSNLQCQ
jgi:hypothetical protein